MEEVQFSNKRRKNEIAWLYFLADKLLFIKKILFYERPEFLKSGFLSPKQFDEISYSGSSVKVNFKPTRRFWPICVAF